MSDDMMTSEYKEQKQRVAVCLTQFQNIQKSKGEASWDIICKPHLTFTMHSQFPPVELIQLILITYGMKLMIIGPLKEPALFQETQF
jgi:hypothetical protein